MITEQEAMTVARAHLARRIRLERVDPSAMAQQGAYFACGGDPHDHHIYAYSLDPPSHCGGSSILAVSLVDGHVDDVGRTGE